MITPDANASKRPDDPTDTTLYSGKKVGPPASGIPIGKLATSLIKQGMRS